MRLIPFLLVLWVIPSTAAIRLPNVIGDHMVLQQNSSVKLWGWSNSGEEIIVTPSWDNHGYDTKADHGARWEVSIPTPAAGGPFTIQLTGSNNILLQDIWIGEVWICSGQSNMEWSALNGFDNADAEVQSADYPQIRFFEIDRTTSAYPQDDCPGTWEICSPETFADFSAVAYFFGRTLSEELKVPIGLIQSAWGGTAAEVWTPEQVINGDADFKNWDKFLGNSDYWPREPASCYNAMIHPIIRYKVAGAIWYQGESNVNNAKNYARLFPAMIESWREAWDFPMPFYYVQIAPYKYGTPLVGAQLREAQLHSMQVPRSGMVVVSDIGNVDDIHPGNKQDVGKRLAQWALAKTYGKSDLDYCGPLYKSHTTDGGQMVLSFDYAEEGLLADGPLEHFQLAGDDRIFFPASAQIDGDKVIVQSKFVLNPVACRYGFKNVVVPRLKNQQGLPASTFRTDDWPIQVLPVDINIAYKPEAEAYLVSLNTADEVDQIKYSTNGDPPGFTGLVYRQPFYIENECTIQALAFMGGVPSDHLVEKEVSLNLATFKPASYQGAYHPDRSGGGDQALIDGQIASDNPNDSRWQGFQTGNLDLTIDFGRRMEVSTISLRALKSQDRKIFLPNKVTFEISNDGQRFVEIYRKPLFHARSEEIEIMPYEFSFRNSRKTRFVRIQAENVGNCPDWHEDAGDPAWLLVDEIVIE